MAGRELDECERGPEVLSESGWDGFLAIVRELAEGFVVLPFISADSMATTTK